MILSATANLQVTPQPSSRAAADGHERPATRYPARNPPYQPPPSPHRPHLPPAPLRLRARRCGTPTRHAPNPGAPPPHPALPSLPSGALPRRGALSSARIGTSVSRTATRGRTQIVRSGAVPTDMPSGRVGRQIGGSARVLPGRSPSLTVTDPRARPGMPWDDSWDEYRPYPCAMCAFRASACGIRAGRTLLAPQRSSFNPWVRVIRGFAPEHPAAVRLSVKPGALSAAEPLEDLRGPLPAVMTWAFPYSVSLDRPPEPLGEGEAT
jgi:hypothetical protein